MNITKLLAGLLIVLALGLALLAWMLGQPAQRPVAPLPTVQADAPPKADPVDQHAVVVIAKPVAAGQRLAAEDVKLAFWPSPVAHGFDNLETVLGMITLVAMPAGVPLFEQYLLHGLAQQLESGQRALAIAVKEQMAAGHHIRPGDFVDVFFTLDARSSQGVESAPVDTQTRLLLARSRVLAYGTSTVENPPTTASQQEAGSAGVRRGRDDPAHANTAVLAVPLEDVERLTLAERYGQLTLALRHPDDMATPDPSLFATLPPALRPAAGPLAQGERLQGMDRSFAGLRFKDLATGAEARSAKPATASPGQPARTPSPRQQTVELHQGVSVQTVTY